MKDEIISLETAKLAKEKGFDLHTDAFHARLEMPVVYAMPTQSLLARWLRHSHRIDIIVEPTHIDHTPYRWYIPGVVEDGYSKTYEQALEQGLQEALKLI